MSLRRYAWLPLLLTAVCIILIQHTGCQTASTRTKDAPKYEVLSSRADRLIARLDNGLIVMAQEIRTAPVASVQCWVKTGSIYERHHNGKGLSHFLEHLASGGSTTTRTESESNEILGRIGADINASTSLDTVDYYIDTSSQHVMAAVDLLSDWMLNSAIVQGEFEREQQVILREFDMGRGDPARILWKLTMLARYRDHPARHPTIGYRDEFLTVSRDELYGFYRQMYVPNNMVFVVAGDIDKRAVVDAVARRWSDRAAGRLPGVLFPVEPPIDQPRQISGEADIDRPRLRLAWPGVRLASEHDYALDLLGSILGQGELSRLVRSVRDDKQLVTSIDAYNFSASWGEGFIGVDAVVAPDKVEEAKRAILAEVDRVSRFGVRADELARAKRKIIADVVYSTQTAHDAGERLASDFIHTGNPDYLQHWAKAVQNITAAQVQTAARKFLRDDRLITITLLPQEGEPQDLTRPPAEPIVAAGQSVEVETVQLDNQALVDRMRSIAATTAAPPAAQVDPVQIHRLSNGLRVIVGRNTRLPIVAMQWYQLGGLLADKTGHEGVANAMAEMMIKGAGDRTADEIARELEGLGAELSTGCGNSTFLAAAQCLAEDWPTVLQLLSDVVQKPTFPDDQWRLMQPRLLAAIDSQDDVWYSQLRNEFRSAFFGEHPWARSTLGRREVVESLTTDQLREFYAQRIGAQNSVLAVFGDFDTAQMLQKVEQLFAAMPAEAAVAFRAESREPIQSRFHQVVTSKPLVAVQIGYGPGMQRNNPDYAALLVMNNVLSSFPVGWFDQALRGEGPGLVYAVGAGVMTGAAPGYWAVLFNTQPQTADEALSRTLQIVDRIRSEPIDEATLNRAATAALVNEASSRQSNAQRAAGAALDELYGVGYDDVDAFMQQIRTVTAEQIRQVAEKYLREPVGVILTNQKLPESQLPPLR